MDPRCLMAEVEYRSHKGSNLILGTLGTAVEILASKFSDHYRFIESVVEIRHVSDQALSRNIIIMGSNHVNLATLASLKETRHPCLSTRRRGGSRRNKQVVALVPQGFEILLPDGSSLLGTYVALMHLVGLVRTHCNGRISSNDLALKVTDLIVTPQHGHRN